MQSRKLGANQCRHDVARSVTAVGTVLQTEAAIWLRNDVTGDGATGLSRIAYPAGAIVHQPGGCLSPRVPKPMHVKQKSNCGFSFQNWCFQSGASPKNVLCLPRPFLPIGTLRSHHIHGIYYKTMHKRTKMLSTNSLLYS